MRPELGTEGPDGTGGALGAVSRAAARAEDPAEALTRIARALVGEPGVDRCLVMEHDGPLDALVSLASADAASAAD